MHDGNVRANAEFRDRAGLQSSAIREGGAKCCEWCASVSGKYPAGDTPQGFWGRHDNCKCSILYETRKGVQRLGGSTKKWEPLDDAGAPEPTRLTAVQAAEREAQHPVILFSPEQAKSLQEAVLTNAAGSGRIDYARIIDSMFYADDYEFQTYTKEEIIANLKTSAVGLDSIQYLENNPQVKVKLSED
ncbi:MAG: hypothetical protein MJ065_08510 [Oscillospiraceae bacterium]|nr:hypothetical protein [Oscillospiraceae bacterium]